MRPLLTALIFALPMAVMAQDNPADDRGDGRAIIEVPPAGDLPPPKPLRGPLEEPLDIPQIDENSDDIEVEMSGPIEGEEILPEAAAPDYSKLSPKAEREARLNDLFEKLAERDSEESANLIAEEIMAIWIDSGSASVNLLLRRGTEAAAKGDPKLARKMYNHAVDLSPNFAEAWARSARLALTQKDYNRALNESLKALALEPRHFYTLWNLGNVLEVLNRQDEALETYREANRLYPELKVVKDRLAELENEVDGTVL